MSNPNAAFAANLGRLRVQRKWSQKRLAAEAGISPSMLSLLECGKNGPTLRTAAVLAGALGTTIDAMLTTNP